MTENKTDSKKIGVFVCWCGHNIAGTVDVSKVVKELSKYPGIKLAKDYIYLCSEPGQKLIGDAIKDKSLSSIICACCSPTLHENTFRKVGLNSGINPYQCEIANIREQCSWVTEDKEAATEKAIRIIKGIIEKVRLNESLEPIAVPVTRRALVIGGGIAGIQAALDIANGGYETILVEKAPSIGGHMAQLSETFPTLDCSQCILTPKMSEVKQHPKIKLLTYSEIVETSGYIGNFKVKVKRKSSYVDETKCNGCADCSLVCPVEVKSEFDAGLGQRRAIYRPFPQAVPSIFTIDKRGHSPCRVACPAGVNAHGYIALIAARKFKEALELERQANPFASVCGRVCNHPCEGECTRKEIDAPIAIASLKRFIADYELKSKRELPAPVEKIYPKKRVAVVGSGPGGLTCAYFLAKQGYPVTVFEALNVVGGMLVTGIPEFRLPRPAINADIEYIKAVGIEIKTGVTIGKDIKYQDLQDMGYKAVFIAVGAHKSLKLDIPGEELKGVLHCIEFLREVNFGRKPAIGKKVAVIGGGNAAIDCARVALRLGAQEVTIVYRRSRREMPANENEIESAIKEGVKIHYLAAPTKIIGKDGKVSSMECIRMELGEPDATGRRRPVPVPGSEFTIEVDNVIPAVSQAPDLGNLPADFNLELTRWGTIVVDPDTLATSIDGVFAGGDAVSGPATIIEAVAAGKKAAQSIHKYLQGEDIKTAPAKEKITIARKTEEELKLYDRQERVRMPELEVAQRANNFKEVELGFSEEDAVKEAQRCLDCSVCCECMECVKVCAPAAIDHNMTDRIEEYDVGAIVVATGFDLYKKEAIGEYGYGRYKDVIDGLQFERLVSASGPTGGVIKRPSDGMIPKRVVFIQCAGSRDIEHGVAYCSKICCMYTTKHAMLYRHHVHDGEAIVFYIDVRTSGKGYEEFYKRATDEGVIYIRGKVSKVYEEDGKVIVLGADTLSGKKVEVAADLVVLATPIVPVSEAEVISKILKLGRDENGFFNEAHPKLRPVETLSSGLFLAGVAQGPKDIPEVVSQASGAASKVLALFSQPELHLEPTVTGVNEDLCSGCGLCVAVCPYSAREMDRENKKVKVTLALCEGCGACSAACPSGAAQQKNLTDRQIEKMVESILE
ncbi:MAG: NAD(P)-binding protein [candidate division WOR-3 bacterium]